MSQEAILELLVKVNGSKLSTQQIAELIGLNTASVSNSLVALRKTTWVKWEVTENSVGSRQLYVYWVEEDE